MILYRKNVIMGKGSGIVAAIAKINGPVQHGDFHFFQWPDFSIVISYIFHIKVLLICNSLLFILITDYFVTADKQGGQQIEQDKAVGQIGISFFNQGNYTDAGKKQGGK